MLSKMYDEKPMCPQDIFRPTNEKNEGIYSKNFNERLQQTAGKNKKTIFKLPEEFKKFTEKFSENKLIFEKTTCDRSPQTYTRIFYPFNSLFSHINSKIFPDEQLESMIFQATAVGADPILALALSLMEAGPEETVSSLFGHSSHARHFSRAMGWSKEKIANSQHLLISNKWDDEDRLLAYAKSLKITVDTSRPSYICADPPSSKILDFGSTYPTLRLPTKFNICQKVNFNVKSVPLRNFFVLNYIRKISQEHGRFNLDLPRTLKNNPPVEFIIQNFQSFSKNTGTGFIIQIGYSRLGTDTIKVPAYGIQAMDYIVNSLLINPKIMNMVERITKGTKIKSTWCEDRSAGFYAVADTLYLNRIRNMERFTSLYQEANLILKQPEDQASEQFKKLYLELFHEGDIDHKKPITKELLSLKVQARLIGHGITKDELKKLQIYFSWICGESYTPVETPSSIGKMLYIYFKEIYALRRTSELTSKDENPSRTWDRSY